MTKLSLELDMDIENYNEGMRSKIACYLQDMDVYLAMYGARSVSFDYYNCEVMHND